MLDNRRERVISQTEKTAFEKFKIPEVAIVDTASPLLCAGPERSTICHGSNFQTHVQQRNYEK